MSSSRRRMPVGPSMSLSFSASLMLTSARPESYSCMPSSKMPDHVKAAHRRELPRSAMARNSGTAMVTLSPTPTPSVSARSCRARCSTSPASARPACLRSCSGRCRRPSAPALGIMPRSIAPWLEPRRRAGRLRARHKAPRPARADWLGRSSTARGQSLHAAADAGDRGVRDHAEDARAQLGIEAVHHRHHRDQRDHADRDADDRDQSK